MKVIRCTRKNLESEIASLAAASSLFDPAIEQRVRTILTAVQDHGDTALIELTQRFDQATLLPEQLPLTTAERVTAAVSVPVEHRRAMELARRNIERFSRKSLRKNWSFRNAQGARVGERFDPFQRVGIYIPGGTAPLLSTALMTVTLAKSAGCPEIVVCTPCRPDGSVDPSLVYAAQTAGATEIYRVGGAQAIAAMAFGTPTLRRVQKIFGPGNAYVVTAKRLLFGWVAVDLLPGPSEVLVIADETAPAAWVAADLLAQAEHGSGHERVWLVTPSSALLAAVRREIRRQLPLRQRRDFIQAALENNGALIRVPALADAARVANLLAPEHCQILTRQEEKVAAAIHTAGALFLGRWSPTVLGDYVAGPSHTLPTGGAGRSFAGLTVDQFQRRSSVVKYQPASLRRSLTALQTFAAMEGLEGHGWSARIRFETPRRRAP